jgi:hypothetical protein
MNIEQEIDPSNRPIYSPVEINKGSAYQLFIGETLSDELNRLYKSCTDHNKKKLCISAVNEFTGKEINADITSFLSTAPLNSTVYIAGSEPFIWKIAKSVKTIGLMDEQIKMLKPESKQRDLFCVHCFTITPGVIQTPAQCNECKRFLSVTEHFSKLHSAYLGYQVNAEVANEIPEKQELN